MLIKIRQSISDNAWAASILNGFKNEQFYTNLVSLFAKKFSIWMLFLDKKIKAKVLGNQYGALSHTKAHDHELRAHEFLTSF